MSTHLGGLALIVGQRVWQGLGAGGVGWEAVPQGSVRTFTLVRRRVELPAV